MYKKQTFTILGGDKRQAVIARRLIERGHAVRVWGLSGVSESINGAEIYTDWKNAVKGCCVVLLPLPVTRDGVNLSLFGDLKLSCTISLDEILNCAEKCDCKYIIGGVVPEYFKSKAESFGISVIDYYKDEQLQINNALPSAEGSLMLAMEHTDKIIYDLPVLICGYGRIGRRLADILHKLGADVTVAARREESLCEIALNGYNAARIDVTDQSQLINALKRCDVIFNTVPHLIFNKKVLMCADNIPLYIEIASVPGGIDICAARDMGMELVFAPSIPGKYAPSTAGEYIYQSIYKILENRGMEL